MKTMQRIVVTGLLAAGALGIAATAQARDVYWSVGVGSPGISVGVGNVPPAYYGPPPVYVQPAPVYVRPAPVYVAPVGVNLSVGGGWGHHGRGGWGLSVGSGW